MLTREEYQILIKKQSRHQEQKVQLGMGSSILSTRGGGSFASRNVGNEKKASFEDSPKSIKSKSPKLGEKARN